MHRKILIVNDQYPSCVSVLKFIKREVTFDKKIIFKSPAEVGMVVFTGGSDVDPNFYGHAKHPTTHVNTSRDVEELFIYKQAERNRIPMVGICRGAQLLCVLEGGKLVQDLEGHRNTSHFLNYVASNGKIYNSPEKVSGDHHQMQYPFNLNGDDYEILAWSKESLSSYYCLGEGKITSSQAGNALKVEPEVVFYPRATALAVQYHPEWMAKNSWGFKYFKHLVRNYTIPEMKRLEKENAKDKRRKAVVKKVS